MNETTATMIVLTVELMAPMMPQSGAKARQWTLKTLPNHLRSGRAILSW